MGHGKKGVRTLILNVAIFPFDWLASWPLPQCLFGQTRGPQFSNENPFRLLLCGIPHEHCTLIVLPLISPDIRIRFWQQG
jgi:hypothetical protein